MSRFHLALLTLGALVTAGAAVITWRSRQGLGSPRDSLQQLAQAARARDRRAIEQYLDVRRVAESVVDETLAAAALGAVATPELQTFEAMRPSLVALVELNIWTTLLDSSASGANVAGAALDLRTLIDRYQGIAGVRQRGRVARVGIRLGLEGDSTAIVQLRMEPAGGHWRVTQVEDLGPYVRGTFERKSERAYEAAMRAYLRNLATAQDAYFAEHATYAPSLGVLRYFETPGVSIEIIAAGRAGWSAVARHERATSECRIGVGSGVRPGDVEREVKCSAPRQRN